MRKKAVVLLSQFLSVYGYLGAQTTTGFTAGASIELSAGSNMTTYRTVIYNALELNPMVEVMFGENLRGYTGFGGSINRFKERAGARINESTSSLRCLRRLRAKLRLS